MSKYMMASGQLIDIENFSEDMVHIEDIAHHLAKIQRFNGATPLDKSYTVGEHSVNLANYFRFYRQLRKVALLHDASEAYLSDLVSPVKKHLSDYQELEEKVQQVIYRKFGITVSDHGREDVDLADKRLIMDEAAAIMPDRLHIFEKELGLEPLEVKVEFNNHPGTVKMVYLNLFAQYGLTEGS